MKRGFGVRCFVYFTNLIELHSSLFSVRREGFQRDLGIGYFTESNCMIRSFARDLFLSGLKGKSLVGSIFTAQESIRFAAGPPSMQWSNTTYIEYDVEGWLCSEFPREQSVILEEKKHNSGIVLSLSLGRLGEDIKLESIAPQHDVGFFDDDYAPTDLVGFIEPSFYLGCNFSKVGYKTDTSRVSNRLPISERDVLGCRGFSNYEQVSSIFNGIRNAEFEFKFFDYLERVGNRMCRGVACNGLIPFNRACVNFGFGDFWLRDVFNYLSYSKYFQDNFSNRAPSWTIIDCSCVYPCSELTAEARDELGNWSRNVVFLFVNSIDIKCGTLVKYERNSYMRDVNNLVERDRMVKSSKFLYLDSYNEYYIDSGAQFVKSVMLYGDLQSAYHPIDKITVTIDGCSGEVSLGAVVKLVSSSFDGLKRDKNIIVNWTFHCYQTHKRVSPDGEFVYFIRNCVDDDWRSLFLKHVRTRTGVNAKIDNSVKDKRNKMERDKERSIKESNFMFLDQQAGPTEYGLNSGSLHVGECILQGDDCYSNLDASLDAISIALTHFRVSGLENELSDFFDGMLLLCETIKSIKNSSSWISVYASLCMFARLNGLKVGSFFRMAGVDFSDNSRTIRFGKPPVDPSFSGHDFDVQFDDGDGADTYHDIGGGIFVDNGTEVNLQAFGFKDIPKESWGYGYKIIESLFGVGVAVVLHKGFKMFVDPFLLTQVTRDSMRSSFDNIIGGISAVFKALAEHDFWKAMSIFRSSFFGEDAYEIISIGEKVEQLDVDKISAPKSLVLCASYSSKIMMLRKNASSLGKRSLVDMCDDIKRKIDLVVVRKRSILEMSGIKTPPPIFIGEGAARTGKSMIPQAIIAAIGSLFELDNEMRREITFYPQNGSEYWEGFVSQLHVHFDEVGSISSDIDKTLGSKLGSMLDIASPVPTGLNMAFESKGKVNTSTIKALSINTNSSISNFVKYFTNPDAVYGRAYFVKVIPGDAVKDVTRFAPLKLKEKTVDELNDNVKFEVRTATLPSPHANPDFHVVYEGDLCGFVKFIYDILSSGYSGERAQVARMFSQITSITVNPGGDVVLPDRNEKVILNGEVFLQGKYINKILDGIGKITMGCTGALSACRVASTDFAVQVVVNDQYIKYKKFWSLWRSFILKTAGAFAGVSALALILYRIKKNSGNTVEGVAQLQMPRPFEEGSEIKGELLEWRNKLFDTKAVGVAKEFMVPLYGGSLVNSSGLIKIEKNAIRIQIESCVDGLWGPRTMVFGYSFNGFGISVGHCFDKRASSYRIMMDSAHIPRGFEYYEVRRDKVIISDDYDVAMFACHMPPSKKDLKRQLKFGKARVGDKVFLLGAFERPRLSGVVNFVGDVDFVDAVTKNIFSVKQAISTSITTTDDGDCSRLLVCVRDDGMHLVGFHFAKAKNSGYALSSPLSDEILTSMSTRLDEVLPQCLMFSDDSLEFGSVLHPEVIINSMPRHGVFSSEDFSSKQRLLPILGVSSNSKPSRSRLVKTVYHDFISSKCSDMGVSYQPSVMSRVYRYDESLGLNRIVYPYEAGLDFTNSKVGCFLLEPLYDSLLGVEKLVSNGLDTDCSPVTLDGALHSFGVLKPVAPSTGAGLHIPGKKGEFVWEVTDNDVVYRAGGQELRESVNLMFSSLARGIVPPGISRVALKDESLKEKKILDVATRLIYVVAFDEYLLCRMMFGKCLGSIYKSLQDALGMCFTVNVFSRDWSWVYNRSGDTRNGTRVRLGGDFKAYDLHHQYLSIFFSLELLCRLIFKMYDWPIILKRVIVCLLWMKLFRVTSVDCVWVQAFFGGHSGDILTVYVNCVAQFFYWFQVWFDCRGGGSFDEFMYEIGCNWNSLGDDCNLSVPLEVSQWFKCDLIVSKMLFRCGQIITGDGAKGDLKYGTENEFLKRKFHFKDGHVFAPLNLSSIFKMLLYFENKNNVNIDDHNRLLLDIVWEESFFHPESDKKFIRDLVLGCLCFVVDKDTPFLSDDQLLERFLANELTTWDRDKRVEGVAQSSRALENNWGDLSLQRAAWHHRVGHLSRVADFSDMLKVQEKIPSSGDCLVSDDGRWSYDQLLHRGKTFHEIWSSYDYDLRPASDTDFGNAVENAHPVVVVNPGENVEISPDDELMGTSTFDATFPLVSALTSGHTRKGISIGELSPDDVEFFKRPVLIETINWTSSPTLFSFKPHILWFNQVMIQNRMQGWKNVRFDLVLRFELSPSFYHYGLARVGAYPLFDLIGDDGSSPDVQKGVAKSSQLHGIWIDAAQPGTRELVLPWIHYQDGFDTGQSGVLSTIYDVVFNPAAAPLQRSDNATEGTVVILVRAYAVNVVRAGPTRVSVVTQSKKVDFESPIGVSGVLAPALHHASKVFDSVAKVPMISGFSKIAAAATAGLSTAAAKLGWSRELTPEHRMVPRVANYSGVDSYDDAYSLSYMKSYGMFGDVSDLCARDEDEMAFAFIAGHESLIDSYALTSDDGYNTLLSTMFVHPMLSWYDSVTSYTTPSSVGWLCGPFAYWSGTLIFSFRIVCSNQHSGALKIVYDPSAASENGAYSMETSRVCILEVKPGATAEIAIGWSQEFPYAQRRSKYLSPSADVLALGYTNGVIRTYVHTPLTCPLSTQGIYVLVSIKGGPDFRVFQGCQVPAITIDTTPPSMVIVGNTQAASVTNISAVGKCRFGDKERSDEREIIFGENIDSVRSVLRRYQYLGVTVSDGAGTAGLTNKVWGTTGALHETMVGGSLHLGSTTNAITVNDLSPFRWFKCMYMGHRGGARYRIRTAQRTIAGVAQGDPVFRIEANFTPSPVSVTTGTFGNVPTGFTASEVIDEYKNESCDVRIPDYSAYRFTPGGFYKPSSGSGFAYWSFTVARPCNDATTCQYNISKAIDHDFHFIGFIGAPVVTQT